MRRPFGTAIRSLGGGTPWTPCDFVNGVSADIASQSARGVHPDVVRSWLNVDDGTYDPATTPQGGHGVPSSSAPGYNGMTVYLRDRGLNLIKNEERIFLAKGYGSAIGTDTDPNSGGCQAIQSDYVPVIKRMLTPAKYHGTNHMGTNPIRNRGTKDAPFERLQDIVDLYRGAGFQYRDVKEIGGDSGGYYLVSHQPRQILAFTDFAAVTAGLTAAGAMLGAGGPSTADSNQAWVDSIPRGLFPFKPAEGATPTAPSTAGDDTHWAYDATRGLTRYDHGGQPWDWAQTSATGPEIANIESGATGTTTMWMLYDPAADSGAAAPAAPVDKDSIVGIGAGTYCTVFQSSPSDDFSVLRRVILKAVGAGRSGRPGARSGPWPTSGPSTGSPAATTGRRPCRPRSTSRPWTREIRP